MGKKKLPKKTKELSVAIAESSSLSGEQITPRKRGRPRKIVEITEEVKESKESQQDIDEEPESKKPKLNEELVKVETTSSTTTTTTQDQPRRSRRKSMPRKSS